MEKIIQWIEDNSKYGSGNGSSYGNGYGNGNGKGICKFNGDMVYLIDGVQTIIKRVSLSLAKGYILNSDLSLTPCYIAKSEGYYAHGKTVKEAQEALQEKIFKNMDTDETINKFLQTFKDGVKYSGKDFFEWHHYLTGSCLMGRESFVRDREIDINDMYTIDEFIEICENAYGGDVIKKLKERKNGKI